MVNLKPANKKDQQTPTVKNRRSSHSQWLFILASVFFHGFLLLLFIAYQRLQPVVEETEENKPIDFVVIPEEESEEPPESDVLAPENSVAQNSREFEEPVDEKASNEVAPSTIKEPVPEETAALSPEPVPEPIPEPVPEPVPEPIPEPLPELEPLPESLPELEPVPELEPEPEAPPEPISQPDPESSVATNLPSTQPETPQTALPPPLPTREDGGASALLGGDYQQNLANGGGDAFFSKEALAYKSVLNPNQINALKDIDLSAYSAEMERITQNWNPSYRTEAYTTILGFNIQKNGQITGLRVIKSSGSPEADRESLEAVQKSAPFIPLPPEFPLETLEVEFSFEYFY